MKTKLLTAVFCLTLSAYAGAQDLKSKASPETVPNDSVSAKLPSKPDAAEKKATNSQVQSNGTYTRPPADKRFKRYINSMFGPTALAKRVVSAGYSTWRNSPEEWGDNWEGFGRRFASGTGRSIIKSTTQYALEEALKLDSAFYRSTKKDFGSRFSNALVSTVTARRPNGKRVLGVPRLVGTYTGSIIAYETWYPRRYDYKDGLRSGTISLGFNAAFNLFKEFVWK